MKNLHLFQFFSLLLLFSCNSQNENSLRKSSFENTAISKIDSTTEGMMTHPNFDSSKISGIGLFKIGNTVENSIGYLLSSEGYSMKVVSNLKEQNDYDLNFSKKQNIIAEINPETTLNRDEQIMIRNVPSIWCKSAKIYLIQQYKIDNLTIQKLVLTYYKGKLVCFFCDYDEKLENAIEAKYGKPDKDLAIENRFFSKVWYNHELEIELVRDLYFKAWINGSYHFIDKCGEHDFEIQNELEKSELKKGLKNL